MRIRMSRVALGALLAGAGYVAATWYRYGRTRPAATSSCTGTCRPTMSGNATKPG